MANFDSCPAADLGFDFEVVHQTARAEDAEPHAALRAILSVEDELDIGDARSLVRYFYLEHLRRGLRIEKELGAAAAGIAEGVSRQFRDSRCDPRLVLGFEPQ